MAEVNTEPPTEASFAPHQAIRPQAHHSGAGAEPHLPSPKGHISQNHINSSGSPKSPSPQVCSATFSISPTTCLSRPIGTFLSSMGTDYKGPLGPPSSLWLSNRVSRQSCTTKHPSSYPMFIGPSNHNRSGGLGTVIKRGSPFCSTRLSTGTQIHQLPFCNTQKGWGPQASDKSSSETQGQLVGAGKSLNGREKNSGEENSRTKIRAPGDKFLPDQFQTAGVILNSDWSQKTFVFFLANHRAARLRVLSCFLIRQVQTG